MSHINSIIATCRTSNTSNSILSHVENLWCIS